MKLSVTKNTIDIGQLRNQITFLIPTQTVGERGNITLTYPTTKTVYARVTPGGNDRSLQEANLTYDEIMTVIVRYDSDFKESWKIRFNNIQYTIHSSTNIDHYNRFIEILCYAKVQ